jgi:hypothetical protein
MLNKLKCPSKLGLWIKSFLSNRFFVVEINGQLSTERSISAGVPQGSCLSPLLFALYINDIGKKLDKCSVSYALFADDILIWYTHRNNRTIGKELQIAINIISRFMNKALLVINEKKTQYLLLTKNSKNKTYTEKENLRLQINGTQITRNLNPTFLGVTFDPELNFHSHFDKLIKKCVSKINLLTILSSKAYRIKRNHLLTIYKSLVLSLFQYSMIPLFGMQLCNLELKHLRLISLLAPCKTTQA